MNVEKIIIDLIVKQKDLEERIYKLEESAKSGNKESGNIANMIMTKSNFSSNGRNNDKYLFQGKKFSKNRLVLEFVRTYVKKNPSAGFDELKVAFPDYLIDKPYGVFERMIIAEKKYPKDYDKRYFTKNDELIELSNSERICVCTQWEQKYFHRILEKCTSEYKYDVKII